MFELRPSHPFSLIIQVLSDPVYPYLMERKGRREEFQSMGLGVRQKPYGYTLQGPTDLELAVHRKQMVCPKEIAALSSWVLASI